MHEGPRDLRFVDAPPELVTAPAPKPLCPLVHTGHHPHRWGKCDLEAGHPPPCEFLVIEGELARRVRGS